jgi:predicted DNA-binding protein with PD1-like motif
MKATVVQDGDVVTYVVVCDPGDEAVTSLTQFARAERLEASQVTAVGAFERATVGWFDGQLSSIAASRSTSSARCCHSSAMSRKAPMVPACMRT